MTWAVTDRLSGSCEKLCDSTTKQLQGVSKDPTVPSWMLFRHVSPPNFGDLRLSPSLSGHPSCCQKRLTCPLATLPAVLPGSPPIARFSQFLPRLSHYPTTSPAPSSLDSPALFPGLSRPLPWTLPFFPIPLRLNFGNPRESPSAHLRCAGRTHMSKKHPRRNCGVFGDFCRPAALWSSERASHNSPRVNPIQPKS
jgi:hypothetical protein